MTDTYIAPIPRLCDIYRNKHDVHEYGQLLLDRSIKGKFKYFVSYSPDGYGKSDPGTILIHYLLNYCECNNTLFSLNTRLEHAMIKARKKKKKKKQDNLAIRVPVVPFKNFKCIHRGVTLYLSNIFISEDYHPEVPMYPPCTLILSVESDCNTHDEFWEKGILKKLIADSKQWHMTNILGEDYNEDNFCEIYTYNDGYWDLKRGNKVRNKETLFLDSDFYDKLLTKIKTFNAEETRKIYNRLNLPYKMNILLHGPPGCGKTSFIEVIASELKRDIRFMQITPKITDEQFSSAITHLGDTDILVCEDIDCLFVERKNSDTEKNAMTFSGLLNCFDGINGGKNGLIVFMTTNYKCRLDKALTRPGRVDIMSEFTYMKKDTIQKMVSFYFEENFNSDEFQSFYSKVEELKLTGAIMSQFLLGMVLDKKYDISKHTKLLKTIVGENNYEENSSVTKSLYT